MPKAKLPNIGSGGVNKLKKALTVSRAKRKKAQPPMIGKPAAQPRRGR
jgi:hypothetical protein